MSEDANKLRELVAEVAAAYFSNSPVSPAEIPNVVSQIAASLNSVGAAPAAAVEVAEAAPEQVKATSAQIRKSITPNALISFEDGKGYKTLKRHLSTRGLSLAQYREKWGLPSDYPTTAPSYSAARSAMAKSLGLGRKAGATVAAPAPAPAAAPVKAKRGRPAKAKA